MVLEPLQQHYVMDACPQKKWTDSTHMNIPKAIRQNA